MLTGLSLENLTRVIHADKQHTITQERFVRQVALAQGHREEEAGDSAWWSKIRRMTSQTIVLTLAVRPLRLTVQWA